MKERAIKGRRSPKKLLYLIAISCIIIFFLIILVVTLDLGEKLRNLSDSFGLYLEISFYILMVIFIIFGIIRPVVLIVKSPDLSIVTSDNKNSKEAIKIYKKVAKTIVKYNDLPSDEKMMLVNYKNPTELLFNISYVFKNSIAKELNGIIIKNAKTVFISTAICQNAKIDMMAVFAINLRMIKELVLTCGFRPSMANLSKLTIRVFGTALIADGIGSLTLQDVLPKSAFDSLSSIPFAGRVVESLTQGSANALLTLRVGCVTRGYLYSDGEVVTNDSIRKEAFKESVKLMPEIMASVAGFFPKKIVSFFKNKKESNEVELNGE